MMNRIKTSILLVFMTLFFSSCFTIILERLGALKSSVSLKKAASSEKEIVFLPMHHVGKKVFFTDVKHKIDSLRKEGFVFYYEGVYYSRINDSLRNDTLAMKYRKIAGVDLRALRSQGGYIDTSSGTFLGLKVGAIKKYDLVNQPKNYTLFDTTVDRRVDVYLSDALMAYEKEYGEVVLTDCDFRTSAFSKYLCKKVSDKQSKRFIHLVYRNEFISREIMQDSHKKIALVYGSKHYEGILKSLQQKDPNWKEL